MRPGLLPGFGEESRLDGLLFLRAIAVQPRECVNEVIGRLTDNTLAQEESFIDSRAKDGPVLTPAVAVTKTLRYTIPAGRCLCVCPAGGRLVIRLPGHVSRDRGTKRCTQGFVLREAGWREQAN